MEATVLLVTDSITLSGKVVTWAIEAFKEKTDRGNNLRVLTQANSLEWKSHFSSSSLDVVVFLSEKCEFHKQNWVVELARVLKPGGVVFIQILVSMKDGITKIHTSLEHSLLLAGFVRPDVVASVEGLGSSDGFELFALRAQKPTWETGSSFSLKNKAVQKQESLPKSDPLSVKLEMNDDLEDLIDEESLLSEEDLKRPSLPSASDCEVSTKRKACKNCTCGRAELEEKQTKLGLTAEQLNNPQSACGNCGLGDAFRCSSCPYKGLSPFKLGEKVSLPGTLLTADM